MAKQGVALAEVGLGGITIRLANTRAGLPPKHSHKATVRQRLGASFHTDTQHSPALSSVNKGPWISTR